MGDAHGFGLATHLDWASLKIGNPPCIGPSCELELSDYQATDITQVAYFPVFDSWSMTITLPSGVLSDIRKVAPTDFMLKFTVATDHDGVADRINFFNASGATPPTLTITYTLP